MPSEYIRQLQKRNYVCEVLIREELWTVLYIGKKFANEEEAKEVFRDEALRIKDEEEGVPVKLVMHL